MCRCGVKGALCDDVTSIDVQSKYKTEQSTSPQTFFNSSNSNSNSSKLDLCYVNIAMS